MKKVISGVIFTGLLTYAGSAMAYSYPPPPPPCPSGQCVQEFTDEYNPDDIYMKAGTSSDYLFWTFNIIDDGYDVGSKILAGKITFNFQDESDSGRESEQVAIDWTEDFWADFYDDVNDDPINVTLGNYSINLIKNDGKLDVAMQIQQGDVIFESASLWVKACDPPAAVPEPTTMLLFGTGLAGLVAFGRRKIQE